MTVTIAVPDDAKAVKRTKDVVEFKLAAAKRWRSSRRSTPLGQGRLERKNAQARANRRDRGSREKSRLKPDDLLRRHRIGRRRGHGLVIWWDIAEPKVN